MKKKFLFAFYIIFCFFTVNLAAQNTLSATATKVINEFMNMKMNMGKYSDYKDCLSGIENFYQKNVVPAKNDLSKQEITILDNLYHTEKAGYYKLGTDADKAKSEKDLLAQLNANSAFISKNLKDYNPWLLVTSANVIGCYMFYHPVKVALKYGMIQKDYYEACYSQAPDFAYGTTHLAQWYFFAPGMYGGSKKKAEELFLKAIKTSATNPERYFTNVFISQFYYEINKKDLCTQYLNKAETYMPGSEYIKRIRKMNSDGYTLFHYEEE